MLHLTIRRDRLEYTFDPGEGGRVSRGLTQVEERALRIAEHRLLTRLRGAPWGRPQLSADALAEVGSYLGTILPDGLRNLLSGAGTVQVECLDDPQLTPWEFAYLSGHCLWQNVSLGRDLGIARKGRLREDSPGVLLFSNPDGLVPGARTEALMMQASLGERMDLTEGAACTRAALEAALRAGYGAMHCSCYCTPEALCLADGVWAPGSMSPPYTMPRLAFLNLWESQAPDSEPLLGRAHNWARRFLDAGSEAVIITAWDVDTEVGAAIVGSFYDHLDTGHTVGQALRAARLQEGQPGDPFLTAHAYLGFGNLDLAWTDLHPLEITTDRSQATVKDKWVADLTLTVIEGPERNRKIPLFLKALEGGALVIGSPGPRPCDIELDDPELENQNARLTLEHDRLWLHRLCLTPEGLRVNGLPVAEKIALEGTETVEMGSSTLQFSRRGEKAGQVRSADPEKARYGLELLGGGRRFHLTRPVELMGRVSDCTVQLDDPSVSRLHATVTWREGVYHLGAVGGSMLAVNGVTIEGERSLKHGDQVQLSESTVLRFIDLQKEGA